MVNKCKFAKLFSFQITKKIPVATVVTEIMVTVGTM